MARTRKKSTSTNGSATVGYEAQLWQMAVPQGVTAERIAGEQNDVQREHQCADAYAESIGKPHGFPDVVHEKNQENEGEVEEVAMHILKDEREAALAPVRLARLANRAGRRVRPERLIVRAAIVVTGQSKAARRPENQKRRREREP